MNKTKLGYLFMLLSAATFASVSVFMKRGYNAGLSPWSFSVVLSLFSMLQLAVLRARGAAKAPPGPRVSWAKLLLFAVTGAAAGVTFNLALVHLSISLGTILLFTYPAFVAIGAWLFLGVRPSTRHLVALLITLVGAVLTVDISGAVAGQVSMLGIGLALLSAVSQAGYIILGEEIGEALSPVAATMLTRLAIMFGSILLYPKVVVELFHLSAEAYLLVILASVVGGVLPFLFLYRGIALIGANRAAIVSVVELPIALALGRVFEGDQISLLQGAGAVLIGVAVVASQSGSAPEDGPA